MCGNWAHIATSKGENSQMINAESRLGQNLSSVDSTTFINLDNNMFTWVVLLHGSMAPYYYLSYIT